MNIKRFSVIAILLLIGTLSINAQQTGEEKYLAMKNAFVLGLVDKGLENALELMSYKEYSDYRERAIFYMAEYFFIASLNGKGDFSLASKSYTYYLVLKNDFPSSQFIKTVDERLKYLTANFSYTAQFRNLLDQTENEASLVATKLLFAETLYSFKNPDPYSIFLEDNSKVSSSQILDRYFEEIITNHPEFEIYANYYKVISLLSQYEGVDYIESGLLDYDVTKYSLDLIKLETEPDAFDKKISFQNAKKHKDVIDKVILDLSTKYTHHPITLNLHLIVAKVFINKKNGKFSNEVKQHLEYVVKNELDKTNPRYLLAREFLLNNKFE